MSDQVKIKVGVEQSAVKTGLAHIKAQFRALKSFAGGMIAAVLSPVALAAAAVAGVVGTVFAAFNKAGQLADMSAQFGISAEALQRVGNVAEQSGVSLESLGGALNKLALNQEKVRNGDEAMAKSLADLGINAQEFINLSPEDAFYKMSDAVAGAEDRGKAYSAVVGLMGKSAGALFGTMSLGSEAIQAQGDAIGVMTDQTVANLDKTADKLDELKNRFLAFAANKLAPILTNLMPDDPEAEKRKQAKSEAAKVQREIESKEQEGEKKTEAVKKREVIADALTRAGGGGIAYQAPEVEAAKQSARSLARIEAATAESTKTLKNIEQKTGWAP